MQTLFLILIIGAVIWRVFSGLFSMFNAVAGQLSNESAPTDSTPPRVTPVERKRSQNPVDWDLIRLHLSPEQIRECFDVAALSRGVSVEDLPRYVSIEKLKMYLPPQLLARAVNLDFFAARQEAPAKSSELSNRQEGTVIASPPSPPSMPPIQHGAFGPSSTRGGAQSEKSANLFQDKDSVIHGVIFLQLMQRCPGLEFYKRRSFKT